MRNIYSEVRQIGEDVEQILKVIDESATTLGKDEDSLAVSGNSIISISYSDVEKLLNTSIVEKEWDNFVENFKDNIDEFSEKFVVNGEIFQKLDLLIDKRIKDENCSDRIEETNYSQIDSFFHSDTKRFLIFEVAYQLHFSLIEDEFF